MVKIIFGLFLVIGILLLMVKAFVFGFGDEILTTGFRELDSFSKLIVIWGFGGALVLWIWMFSDFFKRSDLRFKVTWGWFLLLGSYMVAVVYFAVIYVPSTMRKTETTVTT